MFKEEFKNLSRIDQVNYIIRDRRITVVEKFCTDFFQSLVFEQQIKLLKEFPNDNLANLIWKKYSFKKLSIDQRREYLTLFKFISFNRFFKFIPEKFTVFLLTNERIGGVLPLEELIILSTRLSHPKNKKLKDQVVKFIFNSIKKKKSLEKFFTFFPCSSENILKTLEIPTRNLRRNKNIDEIQLIGFLLNPKEVSIFPENGVTLKQRGAIVFLSCEKTVNYILRKTKFFSLKIVFNNTGRLENLIHSVPIIICLTEIVEEVCNVYIESINGETKGCIGTLTKNNLLFKLTYPLPVLGKYGTFRLKIKVDKYCEKISLNKKNCCPFTYAMVLNTSVSTNRRSNFHQLQFIDIKIDSRMTFNDLLQKAIMRMNLLNIKIFLNHSQYVLISRKGEILKPHDLVVYKCVNFEDYPVFLIRDITKK